MTTPKLDQQKNRCFSCHASVGPSPGWHNCAESPERRIEWIEAGLARLHARELAGLPSHYWCALCRTDWPCQTMRILEGEATP